MRVLVTGGAGFIGSHVVDAFVSQGHETAIIDSFWPHGGGRRQNLNPQADVFEIDIRDDAVKDVFERFRPEIISHHAAQHSVAISTRDPRFDADVNVRGLLNILGCACDAGATKFLYASSAATYGTPQYLPIDEAHPQIPESPYGITKMVGEHYLRYYCQQRGLAFTALRYGNVYGPRQDPNGEAGVIAIFCGRMLRGESLRIDWDGEQRKDYVFVADVARANLLAVERMANDAINIGTGLGTSVNDLRRLIAQAVGHDVEIVRAPKRPGDVRACVFAVDKALSRLKWSPDIALADGVSRTVAYFRNAAGA